MRGALLGTRILWLLSVGLGVSCAQIIGISDYTIDSNPDSSAAGEGGSAGDAGGASSQGASAGQGEAGEPSDGGGGGSGGSGAAGQAGEPTQTGGAGGAAAEGCTAAACDDAIDCTIDSCDENGECLHTPDTSLCDVDEGECLTCKVGLGCVPGELVSRELLVDPNLDELSNAWVQDVRYTTLQQDIITLDDYADSGSHSAWYLGVEATGTEQAYMDLNQAVTIPPTTRALRVTGVYELLNGTVAPDEDYAVVGLFDGADELLEFHQWYGDDPEAVPWVEFEYVAKESALAPLRGVTVSFAIYGYSWDTAFYFDTLSLEATVCE